DEWRGERRKQRRLQHVRVVAVRHDHLVDVGRGACADARQVRLERARRVTDGVERRNQLDAGITAEECAGGEPERQPDQRQRGERGDAGSSHRNWRMASRPAYWPPAPSSSSMRSSWLYLATRSLRLADPVLICP